MDDQPALMNSIPHGAALEPSGRSLLHSGVGHDPLMKGLVADRRVRSTARFGNGDFGCCVVLDDLVKDDPKPETQTLKQ